MRLLLKLRPDEFINANIQCICGLVAYGRVNRRYVLVDSSKEGRLLVGDRPNVEPQGLGSLQSGVGAMNVTRGTRDERRQITRYSRQLVFQLTDTSCVFGQSPSHAIFQLAV